MAIELMGQPAQIDTRAKILETFAQLLYGPIQIIFFAKIVSVEINFKNAFNKLCTSRRYSNVENGITFVLRSDKRVHD